MMYFCIYTTGKTWKFLWGMGSQEYSELVIKSFLCSNDSISRAAGAMALRFKRGNVELPEGNFTYGKNIRRDLIAGEFNYSKISVLVILL